jgi:protease II
LSALLLASCGKSDDAAKAPKAAKITQEVKLVDETILKDDYAWMRDKNWPGPVNDTKVLDHLNSENQYLDSFLKVKLRIKKNYLLS